MVHVCPNCEAERSFRSANRAEEYAVRGTKVTFPVTVEICETCGESLFDEERDGRIVEQAYARYRQQNGLLTPEEIRQARERYCLSQKSFAAILGMSEATINRYENGALQDETHDNLIRFAAMPQVMRDLISRRAERLTSAKLEEARTAIERLLEAACCFAEIGESKDAIGESKRGRS